MLHTIFNVVITIFILPISKYFVMLVNHILPDDEGKEAVVQFIR